VLFCLVGAFTYVNFYLSDAPFHLGPVELSSIFGVYLIGAVVTPMAGQLLDRIGCRAALVAAAGLAACGILLTLIHFTPLVICGLAIAASGAFACQSAASSHVGRAAGKAKSSASGLYVGFYYLGGCCGSILPGLLWKQAGWLGCVVMLVVMQGITAAAAYKLWKE
jgi:predicted MFS family arabinose efflux permease